MRASKLLKIWSVYVLAAPDASGVTYFKIGRTSDISKRVFQVQTGCPLRITMAWVITLWDNQSSLHLERLMHTWLAEFRSHGEWFAMRTVDPEHKAAMNAAFAQAVKFASHPVEKKWRKMEIAELRAAVAAHSAEMTAKSNAWQEEAKRRALTLMATAKRRIL